MASDEAAPGRPESVVTATPHDELAPNKESVQDNTPIVISGWDGPDDPEDPHNWSKSYRWFLTVLMGLLTLNSSFTSSLPSGTAIECMAYFHVSQEVITLAITAYVIGYCLGPLVWAPLSEHVGRWPAFVISLTCYTGFNLGCALSKNIGSLIVFRLLAGSFAAAPLTNAAAVLSDIWDANTRGTAMAIFALAPFAGPALGPTVSGAIYVSGTLWRWTYYVATMFSGVCSLLAFFLVKETYKPVLLARKAKRMRKETGDERYVAPIEQMKIEPRDFLKKTLLRPFIILAQEPMLIAMTLYTSFIYGVLYLLFEAFPLTFGGVYGLNMLLSGLCFLPFFVGGAIACLAYVVFINPKYKKDAKAAPYGMLAPESRLPIACVGGPCVAVSAFWIAWTCYPSISIWCSLISTSLLGFGFIWVFQGLFNYIIDVYMLEAASAMAANTVVRSIFGAAFPLFSSQMMNGMGLHWGYTLVAFISTALVPIPFALVYYGPKLRAMSKNTMSIEEVMAAMGGGAPPQAATPPADEEAAPAEIKMTGQSDDLHEKAEESGETPHPARSWSPSTQVSPTFERQSTHSHVKSDH